MKSITVIGLLICVLTANVSADLPSEVEANFRAIFEFWKSGEIHNKVPFEVPHIEPFRAPPFCDNINKLGVKTYVETGVLELYGLKSMTLDKITVSDTGNNIAIEASAPQIRLHSDTYTLRGKALFVYNVKGSGKLDITLFNIRGTGKLHFKATDTGTEIDAITVKVGCEKAEGNLQDASWPINNIINTKGRLLVEAFHVEIQKIATQMIQKIFKEPLSKIKFDDLLQYTKDILDDILNSIHRTDNELTHSLNNATATVLQMV